MDQINQTSQEQKKTSEKINFFRRFRDACKKGAAKIEDYLTAMYKEAEIKKRFQTESATFTDLTDGSFSYGLIRGDRLVLPADHAFVSSHRYYAEGRTYAPKTSEAVPADAFRAEGCDAALACVSVPYEIILTPLGDLENALDSYENVVKAYRPVFPYPYRRAQFDVIVRFVDFRKAVAEQRRDPALFCEIVEKCARFAPEAARTVAEITSNLP